MKKIIAIIVVFTAITAIAQGNYPVSEITGIESDIPFQGYFEDQAYVGYGEYQIFYSEDGVLDMPLIITDGYDPGDNNGIGAIYHYLTSENGDNLFDTLRGYGVDIVILNFPEYTRDDNTVVQGGSDYIERNAYVLVALLEDIIEDMEGNEQFVVVGPSMGGLVTRYALAYMEQNGMDHNTGLWLSFDAPHYGANIPISLQYLVNYMAVQSADPDVTALRDNMLNTPAAMQLLLDHYTAHIQEGSDIEQDYLIQLPTPAEVYRENFTNAIEALGFPQATRNLTIIDGSDNSGMVESPGTTIVDTEFDLGSGVGLKTELYFTPEAGVENYVVDYLQPTIYGFDYGDPYYTYASSPATSAGLDSAPGGTVLMDEFFAGTESDIINQFYDALQIDAFSFIPALSALGVPATDWYAPVSGIDLAETPFDAASTQNDNLVHLAFTQNSFDFVHGEILSHFNITGIPGYSLSRWVLKENPVSEYLELSLEGHPVSGEMHIRITDGTGRRICDFIRQTAGENLLVPAPSTPGMYYLEIGEDTYVNRIKFIVK